MERYIQRNWLKQLTAKLVAEDKITSQAAQTINDEAAAVNDHALYKIFKAIAGFIGVLLIFAGIHVILVDFMKPESLKDLQDFFKKFSFFPIIVGGGFYAFYYTQKRTSKLWKELAVPLFFIGAFMSLVMMKYAMELDFVNIKILIYIVLTFGLWLIYKHNSLVTACIYIYLLTIIAGLFTGFTDAFTSGFGGRGVAGMVGSEISKDYTWLWIFMWAYLVAIVPFLIHRLKGAGIQLGIKEAIVGGLFVNVAYQFAIGLTAGYGALGLLVIMPTIYMISKRYFAQATWFYNRPGSTALVVAAVIMTLVFSNKGAGLGISGFGLTDTFELDQILALLVIIAIGLYGFKFYKDEIEANNIKLNWVLLAFPAVVFISGLIGSDYAYIVYTLYGFALFGNYVKEGLAMKYPPLIILGAGFGLIFVCARILVNMMETLAEEDSLIVIGLIVIFFGALWLGTVMYLKNQWSVSDDNANPDDDNLLDNTLSKAKNIDVKAVIDDYKDTVQNANKPSTPKAPPASPAPSAPETPSEPESNNDDSSDDSDNGANESDSANDEPKTES